MVSVGWWAWRTGKSNPLRRTLTWKWLVAYGVAGLLVSLLRGFGQLDWMFDQGYFRHDASDALRDLNPNNTIVSDWPLLLKATDKLLDWFLAAIAYLMIAALATLMIAYLVVDARPLRSLKIAFLAASLLVALWELAMEPINLMVQWAEDRGVRHPNPTFTFWYSDGCLISLTFALTGVILFLIVCRHQWTKLNGAGSWPDNRPLRLIVGEPIQFFIVSYILFIMFLQPFDTLYELRLLQLPYGIIYLIGLLVVGVTLGFSRPFRNLIHVLTDVIIHFEGPNANSLCPRHLRMFVTRRRIGARFTAVLEKTMDDTTTHLVVIAHSQGTVIALEGLRRHRWHDRFARLEQVTLITLGSPFTHIYQEYFPNQFGPIQKGKWLALRRNVRTWVNLFRVDDYVGTHIESADSQWPSNVALPPGQYLRGHTHYWETDVFEHIGYLLPGGRPRPNDDHQSV